MTLFSIIISFRESLCFLPLPLLILSPAVLSRLLSFPLHSEFGVIQFRILKVITFLLMIPLHFHLFLLLSLLQFLLRLSELKDLHFHFI